MTRQNGKGEGPRRGPDDSETGASTFPSPKDDSAAQEDSADQTVRINAREPAGRASPAHLGLAAFADPSDEAPADRKSLTPRKLEELEELLKASLGTEKIPERIGPYRIVRLIGHGTFGDVYEGCDEFEIGRVAVKVLKDKWADSKKALEAFLNEARIGATLNHAHIIPLYHAGVHEGKNYLAMAFCPGPSLRVWMREQELIRPRDAARFVEQLAGAVQHIHEHRILHRDIKAANILMAPGHFKEDLPIPKLVDFGLARWMKRDSGSDSTDPGGTLACSPPEQAIGRTRDLDERADVYSLGLVLYELITGFNPFRGDNPLDTVKRVLYHEPPSPRSVRPETPVDLEVIALKCLAKSPGDRFASARELKEDLERFLKNEPIKSRKLGRIRRAARWVARNPGAALLGAVTFAAVTGLGTNLAITIGDARAREIQEETAKVVRARSARAMLAEGVAKAAEVAEVSPGTARAILDFSKDSLPAGVEPDFAWRHLDYRVDQPRSIQTELPLGPAQIATLSGPDGNRRWIVGYSEARSLLWLHDLDTEQTHRLERSGPRKLVATWSGKSFYLLPIVNLAEHLEAEGEYFEPGRDGTLGECRKVRGLVGNSRGPQEVVPIGENEVLIPRPNGGTLSQIWSIQGQSGRNLGIHNARTAGTRTGASALIAVDSNLISFYMSSRSGSLETSIRSLRLPWTITTDFDPMDAHPCISADGRLAAITFHGRLAILETATGETLELPCRDEYISAMAFSGDNRFLATSDPSPNKAGGLSVWDLSNPGWHCSLNRVGWPVNALNFTTGSRELVASAPDEPNVWIWNLAVRSNQTAMTRLTTQLNVIQVEADGNSFLVAGEDESVRRIDAKTGQVLHEFAEYVAGVTALEVEPSSGRLIAGHWDRRGWISIRGLSSLDWEPYYKIHTAPVRAITLSPDGRFLATGGRDESIRIHDLTWLKSRPMPEPISHFTGHDDDIRALEYTTDGRTLVSASEDGTIRTWRAPNGPQLRRIELGCEVTCLALIPGEGPARVAAGLSDGRLILVDVESGQVEELGRVEDVPGILSLAISPDGRTLASGGCQGSIHLWSLEPPRRLLELELHKGEVRGLAFSPDGSTLYSVGQDGQVGRFETRNEAVATPLAPRKPIESAANGK